MDIKGKVSQIETFGLADGPGVRFVIFMQGCNMRCKYCHNPETRSHNRQVTLYGAGELIKKALRYKSYQKDTGGITVSGGEPLCQMDFVTELFKEAKKLGIHTALDTSGILFTPNNTEKFDELIKYTDLVMLDIKHIDPEMHKKITSQPNDGILAFAQYLSDKGIDTWIRHVVVPNLTDDEKYLYDLGYFIGGLKTLKALDVLPYHTMGKPKYEKLGMEYPLADTPAMEKKALLVKKQAIIDGIKARRAQNS